MQCTGWQEVPHGVFKQLGFSPGEAVWCRQHAALVGQTVSVVHWLASGVLSELRDMETSRRESLEMPQYAGQLLQLED